MQFFLVTVLWKLHPLTLFLADLEQPLNTKNGYNNLTELLEKVGKFLKLWFISYELVLILEALSPLFLDLSILNSFLLILLMKIWISET
jgi:hypothetical protein